MLAWVFALFNHAFDALGSIYTWIVGKLLTLSVVVVVVYGGLLVLTYQQVEQTPKGFIPSQDMGYLFCAVQLPDSASLERTEAVMAQVGQIARSDPGIDHTSEISGTSFLLNSSGSNFGTSFIRLKDYSERRDPNLASDKILARLTQQFEAKIVDARAMVLPPPPVRGVGRAGGFMLMLEDRGDVGPAELQAGNRIARGDRQSNERFDGAVFGVSRQCAAIESGARHARVHGETGFAARFRRCPAGVSRLALRERFQPLRPHLAGHRASGAAISQPDRRHSPAPRAQRERFDGAAGIAGQHSRGEWPVGAHALQRLPGGGD